MDSISKLNQKILKITMQIWEKAPELVRFLSELTESIPDLEKPVLDRKRLEQYYQSLKSLLDQYLEKQETLKT